MFVFLRVLRLPRDTLTDIRFPYTTRCRSGERVDHVRPLEDLLVRTGLGAGAQSALPARADADGFRKAPRRPQDTLGRVQARTDAPLCRFAERGGQGAHRPMERQDLKILHGDQWTDAKHERTACRERGGQYMSI